MPAILQGMAMANGVGFKSGILFTLGAIVAIVVVCGVIAVGVVFYQVRHVQKRGEISSFLMKASYNTTSNDYEHFITATESCKGKSFIISMKATGYGDDDNDGTYVVFQVFCGRQKANVLIYCPHSVCLFVDIGTEYAVQFTCNDGKLDSGNVATRMRKMNEPLP